MRWTELTLVAMLAVAPARAAAQDESARDPGQSATLPEGSAAAEGGGANAPAAAPGGSAAPADAAASPKTPFPGEGPVFDRYRDIAKDLRCPTCTGLSVLESDAKFSEQIKSIVQEQVIAGKSKDEIFQYFTERYGPWILRAPPKTGFNAVAWAFPIVLLVLGPPLVYVLIWRRRKQVATYGVRAVEVVVAEMQDELAKLRADRGGRA